MVSDMIKVTLRIFLVEWVYFMADQSFSSRTKSKEVVNTVKISKLKMKHRKILNAIFSKTFILICITVLFAFFKKGRIEYKLEECLCGHYDFLRAKETTRFYGSTVSKVFIVSTLDAPDIDRLIRYMRVQEFVIDEDPVIEEITLFWDDLLNFFVGFGLVSSRQPLSHYTIYSSRDPVDYTLRSVLVEKSTNRVFIYCSGV